MAKNILVVVAIVVGMWVYATGEEIQAPVSSMEEKVLPADGVTLPVQWGDLGKQLITAGVIDEEKFEQLYARRGGLTTEMKAMLQGENNGQVKITTENAGVVLNLLWALGLGSKNEILEKGPMTDKNFSGDGPPAGGFASTGGWTLAKGDAMDHYSRHQFFSLTPEQQQIVERVSKNIYRPCCGNSTYFPDCNHGMAMLGLLELMASQGVSEKDMYRTALTVNVYWFPDTYLTIATYMKNKGIEWSDVNPQEILGVNYSSGQGYRQILAKMNPVGSGVGSSCGV